MSEPTAHPQQQVTPVCPRHPDRVSYVRCQRCGRPVCPDCQRPAAVGVQCVDCVKAQAKTVRTTRTVFGGNVSDTPVVSYAIIAICVVVFVLQTARPGTDQGHLVRALPRAERAVALPHLGVRARQHHAHPVQHAGPVDGGGAVPRAAARRGPVCRGLPRQRHRRLGRSTCSWPPQCPFDPQLRQSWYVGAVGASGAVFGLFGALLVLNRHLGRSSASMYATIGINAVIGFVIPNVAWQAHLGGLVTGAAVAGVIAATSAKERRRWQWPGIVLVLLVVVAAAIVKYAVVAGRAHRLTMPRRRRGRITRLSFVPSCGEPCGQPGWGGLVGQRQRVVIAKPPSIRPNPTPRFQRPIASTGKRWLVM